MMSAWGSYPVWILGGAIAGLVFSAFIMLLKRATRDRRAARAGVRASAFQILADAARGMAKVDSRDRLLRLVVHFITLRVGIRNAAVLVREPANGAFKIGAQRGYGAQWPTYRLELEEPLVQALVRGRDVVNAVTFAAEAQGKMPAGRARALERRFAELGASCLVPGFLGKELAGILVLGPKRSGEPYTQADGQVLLALAQEAAIALENARLMDECRRRSRELDLISGKLEGASERLARAFEEAERANQSLRSTQVLLASEQRMATLGRLAASVGHEVNNPLTVISMQISRIILNLRKNPDLKVCEVVQQFQKMEYHIERIKAVVNTLTGLLKKSEKGKLMPLSVKILLEETLPLVRFQASIERPEEVTTSFHIPADLPLVHGDPERLQEVFLNLFVNAYQAMEGASEKRIEVTAERDPENEGGVVIRFADSGCGMDEDTLNKIFQFRFTTKREHGSGIGLYMCRYILDLHHGTIGVSSEKGAGTTFTLKLPAARTQAGSGFAEAKSA